MAQVPDAGLLGFTDAGPGDGTAMHGFGEQPLAGAADYGADYAAAEYVPPAAAMQMDAPLGGGFGGDPMSFVGGGDPPGGNTSPAGYVDPFQGVPVKETTGKTIPEMNALREWEDKHERELEEVVRKEETDKKERRKGASEELQKWYDERSGNIQKRHGSNRKEEEATEQSRADAQKPGANAWERVVDMIDTSARAADESRDTSRMRTLLIQLKSNPVVTA